MLKARLWPQGDGYSREAQQFFEERVKAEPTKDLERTVIFGRIATMLKVLTLNRNSIKCQIIDGSRRDDIVSIPKIGIFVSEFEKVQFVRHKFPIWLAFAATINKAQGQTLAKCGIYLQQQVFAHGQLYVAFSRVRYSEDISVRCHNEPSIIEIDMFPTSSDVPSYFQIDLNVLQHSGLKKMKQAKSVKSIISFRNDAFKKYREQIKDY
ncbi:hypothetical protein MP228_008643 [Amoeboaphelidium protococcarum]|nr:hypothetical protein MP228_008643 [Amoeboaphelidium protococcarum]